METNPAIGNPVIATSTSGRAVSCSTHRRRFRRRRHHFCAGQRAARARARARGARGRSCLLQARGRDFESRSLSAATAAAAEAAPPRCRSRRTSVSIRPNKRQSDAPRRRRHLWEAGVSCRHRRQATRTVWAGARIFRTMSCEHLLLRRERGIPDKAYKAATLASRTRAAARASGRARWGCCGRWPSILDVVKPGTNSTLAGFSTRNPTKTRNHLLKTRARRLGHVTGDIGTASHARAPTPSSATRRRRRRRPRRRPVAAAPGGCGSLVGRDQRLPKYATAWYAWARKLDDGDTGNFTWLLSDVLTVHEEQEAEEQDVQQEISPAAGAILKPDTTIVVDEDILNNEVVNENLVGGLEKAPINDGTVIRDDAVLGNIREDTVLDGNNVGAVTNPALNERDLTLNQRDPAISNTAAVGRAPIFRRSRRELLPDYYGRVDPPTFTGTYTEAWGPILATCAAPPPSPSPPPPPSPPPRPPSSSPPPTGILIIPPTYKCSYFGLHSAQKTTRGGTRRITKPGDRAAPSLERGPHDPVLELSEVWAPGYTAKPQGTTTSAMTSARGTTATKRTT